MQVSSRGPAPKMRGRHTAGWQAAVLGQLWLCSLVNAQTCDFNQSGCEAGNLPDTINNLQQACVACLSLPPQEGCTRSNAISVGNGGYSNWICRWGSGGRVSRSGSNTAQGYVLEGPTLSCPSQLTGQCGSG
ncbi:hypothetical protein WJX73_010923 [Symbiochloris irregularis]|uniref:Uncharacterized protein n=1 Tax=Symbiochloris irregularis TaxID=706552 RepID=A0AAW1PBE9_9CHLO